MPRSPLVTAYAVLASVALAAAGDAIANERFGVPEVVPSAGCASVDDATWWDGFKLPVHNGSVFAVLPDGPDLIVGGSFTQAGSAPAVYVARWNGVSWSALGDGLPAAVHALAWWNGRLVAGVGNAGGPGIDTPLVYELIGNQWQPLGTMREGYVRALAVHGGDLIAGGSFTHADAQLAASVARWDGTAWHAMSTGLGPEVRHLVPYDGKLIAAGTLTAFGDIAQWDGTSWSSLGDGFQGVNPGVLGLATDGDLLHASGYMESSGAVTFTGLPVWDGSTWSSLGSSSDARRSYSLAAREGDLYSTDFDSGPQRWTGTSWTSLTAGFAGPPEVMAIWGDRLVAADGIGQIPVRMLNDIAVYENGAWQAVFDAWSPGSSGHHGSVRAAVSWNGQLVVGGGTTVGAEDHFQATSGVASWNGAAWTSLGPALPSGGVFALTSWNGDLVAGGFSILGNTQPTRYVARWNGSSWVGLGSGLTNRVYGLAPYGPDLVAVGAFSGAVGGPTLNGIGRWNGSVWAPLGTGFTTNVSAGIYPRAALEHEGDLVVAGSFTAAGGVPAANVARWDGAVWHAMGAGTDATIHALAAYAGGVVAAGDFTTAGGLSAEGVAFWDGSSWNAMGTNAVRVEALRVVGGNLFAAGHFRCADQSVVPTLALWDGTSWKHLSTGFDPFASFRTLEAWNGDLYVGGTFTRVGSKPSWRIARWSGLAAVGVTPREDDAARLRLAIAPNPARGALTLRWSLPAAGHVRVAIHDVTGRELAVLAHGRFEAGAHAVRWTGEAARLAPGVYWASVATPWGTRSVRWVHLD